MILLLFMLKAGMLLKVVQLLLMLLNDDAELFKVVVLLF